MKVSMYIVEKWLSDYSPEAHINNGDQEILGVRYFTEDAATKPEFLYIGHNRDFIETDKRGVICANGDDIILLNTDDIYKVFNEMQEMLEFYNAWEMNIMKLIEENASVGKILEETVKMLGYGLVLTDATHFVLGEVQEDEAKLVANLPGGRLSDEMIADINVILKEHSAERKPYLGARGSETDLLRNFFDAGSIIGWLVVIDVAGEKNMEALMQITESFSRLLEFWFRINKDALKLSDMTGVFTDILEEKEADPSVISARMSGIGWANRPRMLLAKIVFPEEGSLNRAYLSRTIPDMLEDSCAFIYEDELILLANLSKGRGREEKVMRALKDIARRYRAVIGTSYSFEDIENLKKYLEQTDIALEYGKGAEGCVYTCEENALAYMRAVARKNLTTDISHRALNALREYDEKHGTEYYDTLGAYLLNERDQTLTAQKLHIHRNSLIYRIKKIEEITEVDLQESSERLYLTLSYFIRDKNFGK